MIIPVKEWSRSFRFDMPEQEFVTLYPAPLEEGDRFFSLLHPAGSGQPALPPKDEKAEIPEKAETPEKAESTGGEGEGEEKTGEAKLPKPKAVAHRGVDYAGVYRLYRQEGSSVSEEELPVGVFAANVKPEEGDLTRISEEDLRKRFKGFEFDYQRGDLSSEKEMGVKMKESGIWRILLYGLLACLLLESLFAWFISRRREA